MKYRNKIILWKTPYVSHLFIIITLINLLFTYLFTDRVFYRFLTRSWLNWFLRRLPPQIFIKKAEWGPSPLRDASAAPCGEPSRPEDTTPTAERRRRRLAGPRRRRAERLRPDPDRARLSWGGPPRAALQWAQKNLYLCVHTVKHWWPGGRQTDPTVTKCRHTNPVCSCSLLPFALLQPERGPGSLKWPLITDVATDTQNPLLQPPTLLCETTDAGVCFFTGSFLPRPCYTEYCSSVLCGAQYYYMDIIFGILLLKKPTILTENLQTSDFSFNFYKFSFIYFSLVLVLLTPLLIVSSYFSDHFGFFFRRNKVFNVFYSTLIFCTLLCTPLHSTAVQYPVLIQYYVLYSTALLYSVPYRTVMGSIVL